MSFKTPFCTLIGFTSLRERNPKEKISLIFVHYFGASQFRINQFKKVMQTRKYNSKQL